MNLAYKLEAWSSILSVKQTAGSNHTICDPLYEVRQWFQIFFIFTPTPGEMIQFDEHIFQMGWFNHQPDTICDPLH